MVNRSDTKGPGQAWELPVSGLFMWLSLPLLLFLMIPLIALMLRSPLMDLGVDLKRPEIRQALTLSLWTTLIATGITVLAGTPAAYFLARSRLRFTRLLDTFVDLPVVLPPAVAGVALLMAFGRRGLIGSILYDWGFEIAFTTTAVVMAQIFVASPFYVRSALVGFRTIDRELEQAASLDGASDRQILRYITLPMARNALLGGSVLTWARALGEFGATIIFAGNYPGRTQTMPLAIYIGFELDLNVALVLSVILLTFAFLVLLLVKWALHSETVIMRRL